MKRAARPTQAAQLRHEAHRQGRALELISRRAVAELTVGRYRSRFKGRGNAFSEVRMYAPGDEPRTIDWNVTARTGSLHVKVFEEERELVVWLVVDLSGSTSYGSRFHSKAEAACRLAACLAQAGLSAGDRVGLLTFGAGGDVVIPPRKGRAQAVALFDALAHAGEAAGARTLDDALCHLLQLRRRPALVFVLSDFDPPDDARRALAAASQRFDLVPVVYADPAELRLPRGGGNVLLEDAETGTRLVLDSSSPSVRRAVEQQASARRQEQERLFRGLQLDAVWLDPEDDGLRALDRLMSRRAIGRRSA